jgi:hypothetical protein
MKICEWCKREFKPANDEQAYCKPTHSTKANRKRRKDRLVLEVAGKCPTPYKRSWSSPEQAALFNLPTDQYLYQCRCGATHSATNKAYKKAAAA